VGHECAGTLVLATSSVYYLVASSCLSARYFLISISKLHLVVLHFISGASRTSDWFSFPYHPHCIHTPWPSTNTDYPVDLVTTSSLAKTRSTALKGVSTNASRPLGTRSSSASHTASTTNGKLGTASHNGGDPTSKRSWSVSSPVFFFPTPSSHDPPSTRSSRPTLLNRRSVRSCSWCKCLNAVRPIP
jgi:hypothetical protein